MKGPGVSSFQFRFNPTFGELSHCSAALKGRRFGTWEEVCRAVDEATAFWNKHRHPFVWGAPSAAPATPPAGNRGCPQYQTTCRMNH